MSQHLFQNPSDLQGASAHDSLPVTRLEHNLTVGQLGGLSAKVDLIWEEFKKTASAETVAKVEQVQKEHTKQITTLQGEMTTVQVDVAKTTGLGMIAVPFVFVYERILSKMERKQFMFGVGIFVMVVVGYFLYWGTELGGFKNQDDLDHNQAIQVDSIAHAHAMDMMRLQIEFQEATRRAPTNITVEQNGRVVSRSSEQNDSLPANFGVDAPLYTPQPIDAP